MLLTIAIMIATGFAVAFGFVAPNGFVGEFTVTITAKVAMLTIAGTALLTFVRSWRSTNTR
jgi:hypothetical protein